MDDVDVSVIMVSYNTEALLPRALAAVAAAAQGLRVQVVVVDNASRDGSVALLRRDYPQVELIENQENVGFGRANNQALQKARGRYLLLLNTDAFVAPDALAKSVAYMETHPRCGILGAQAVGEDGALQPSARNFITPWNMFIARSGLQRFLPWRRLIDDEGWERAANHERERSCDWVPGCYYLVRRRVVQEVGLFDPRYFLYFEEVDLCRSARKAGWDVIYFPQARVLHLGGASARSDGELSPFGQLEALHLESELIYFRKHWGLPAALANAFLVPLADLVNVLRYFVKHRGAQGRRCLARYGGHALMEWRLLWATRLGSRPTR